MKYSNIGFSLIYKKFMSITNFRNTYGDIWTQQPTTVKSCDVINHEIFNEKRKYLY
jgi:hypothetical protein